MLKKIIRAIFGLSTKRYTSSSNRYYTSRQNYKGHSYYKRSGRRSSGSFSSWS